MYWSDEVKAKHGRISQEWESNVTGVGRLAATIRAEFSKARFCPKGLLLGLVKALVIEFRDQNRWLLSLTGLWHVGFCKISFCWTVDRCFDIFHLEPWNAFFHVFSQPNSRLSESCLEECSHGMCRWSHAALWCQNWWMSRRLSEDWRLSGVGVVPFLHIFAMGPPPTLVQSGYSKSIHFYEGANTNPHEFHCYMVGGFPNLWSFVSFVFLHGQLWRANTKAANDAFVFWSWICSPNPRGCEVWYDPLWILGPPQFGTTPIYL